MKRLINLGILFGSVLFIILAVTNVIHPGCLLKRLFGINCPGCGITRGFRAILNGKLSLAYNYNILSIPLFIISIMGVCLLIKDIIKNENNTINLINEILKNNYLLIIVLLIITMIINNIRCI